MPGHRFDRNELAGSLGDLGTLLPLAVALITINHLNATVVLVSVGTFYVALGLYYRLPVPVQPLKLFAAIAIAQSLTVDVISAGSLLMAAFLLFLSLSGLIVLISKLFNKPIIRGIQLGLGLTLILKGLDLITKEKTFLIDFGRNPAFENLLIGIMGFIIALVLINNRKFPAALVLIGFGIAVGLVCGGAKFLSDVSIGFQAPQIAIPNYESFVAAAVLLFIPQVPLTIGNAVIGTRETAVKLYGEPQSARVTHRALCFSMGAANALIGALGGMPVCHGAGGLAAHYRFGARSGGSNLLIGIIFVVLGLVFGRSAFAILCMIPNSILGVLLFFAGAELSLMIKDLPDKSSLFTAVAIAGIALATKNMGIAFATGMVIDLILRKLKISFG